MLAALARIQQRLSAEAKINFRMGNPPFYDSSKKSRQPGSLPFSHGAAESRLYKTPVAFRPGLAPGVAFTARYFLTTVGCVTGSGQWITYPKPGNDEVQFFGTFWESLARCSNGSGFSRASCEPSARLPGYGKSTGGRSGPVLRHLCSPQKKNPAVGAGFSRLPVSGIPGRPPKLSPCEFRRALELAGCPQVCACERDSCRRCVDHKRLCVTGSDQDVT